MLSHKAKYALKALLVLSQEQTGAPMLISEVARREAIPKKFLELILLELKNQGILQSKKGKGGGYFLGRSASQIPLGTIIRIMDGPLAPVPCVSETAYRKCDECVDEESCGVRLLMRGVRDAAAQILDGTTLADLRATVAKASKNGKRARRSGGKT